jgi:hypothetical protein
MDPGNSLHWNVCEMGRKQTQEMENSELKGLLNLMDNKNPLTTKELEDLEILSKTFGKKFETIDIRGDFVYGYTKEKKEYLGREAEYNRYKILKRRKSRKDKNNLPNNH